MIYKTLTLRLFKPGARKRALLDDSLRRYAAALQYLLESCEPEVERLRAAGKPVRKAALLNLVGPEQLGTLNRMDVQPFKDSLKMEFAALCSAYIAQSRSNDRASYPCVVAHPQDAASLLDTMCGHALLSPAVLAELDRQYQSLCARCVRQHPLYFGRYDRNRDFCLLYDEYTGRFYVKLYLLNAAQAFKPEGRHFSLRLRYVTKEGGPLGDPPARGERYLIVPLAFGKKQLEDLNRALKNPSLLHTARLIKRKSNYYLLLNMECAASRAAEPRCTLGVARGLPGGLHYTFCRPDGEAFDSGFIDPPAQPCQRPFVLARDVLTLALRETAQVVVEAYGGRRDSLSFNGGPSGMKGAEYRAFVRVLSYKLPEAGLPAPVAVSPKGLYSMCPACRCVTRRSRISGRLFACVSCGFATDAALIGSLNLARRLSAYKSDRVPVRVRPMPTGLLFYNKTLGFELTLPPDTADFSAVYYELSLLAKGSKAFEADTKKYAMLQKLRAAADIHEAVRILWPSGAAQASSP